MLLLKMTHLLFLFVWIGSLLTLTLLTGYFKQNTPIYRRLYLMVDLPAMLIAIITGLVLFNFNSFEGSRGWLHMKLTFALLLILCDILTGIQLKNLILKSLRFKCLHAAILLCLIGTVSSIYLVRNKEGEIRTRFERELGKKEQKTL